MSFQVANPTIMTYRNFLFFLASFSILSTNAQTKLNNIRVETRAGEHKHSSCEKTFVLIPLTTYDSIEIYINDSLCLEESISFKELADASAHEHLILPIQLEQVSREYVNFKLRLIRRGYTFEKKVKFPEGYCFMTLDLNIDRRTKADIQKIKDFNVRADSCRKYPELWEGDDICPEPIPEPDPDWKDHLILYFRNSLPGPCFRRG
jgi:hypothetical protein